MKVLVTGSSGFVGGYLLTGLANAGHIGLAVSRRTITELPPNWSWVDRELLLKGASQSEDELLAGVEVVIHLEVKQHVQNPTGADLAAFRQVNVAGTQQWLEWCSAHAIRRFVYFSTIKAVERDGESQDTQTAIDERATGSGETPYGRSKWEAEQLVSQWAREQADRCVLILRSAVVYGPGNIANLFSMVDALAKGRFFLVGSNGNIKSLVSVKNLFAAVVYLLPRMTPGVEIYNITDAQSYSVRELAGMIAKELQINWQGRSSPMPIAKCAALLGDVFAKVTRRGFPLTSNRLAALLENTHFSCAKLLSTGFRHLESTQEGLAEMVKWYRTYTKDASREAGTVESKREPRE